MEKKNNGIVIKVAMIVGLGAYWVLRIVLALASLGLSGATVVTRKLQQKVKGGNLPLPTGAEHDQSAATHQTGVARQISVSSSDRGDFEPADRIVTIRLSPAVAVIHLLVYHEKKVIKREMIVIEPRLRGLMEGRRHTLPTVPYEPDKGFADVKDKTVAEAQEMINRKGNFKVKAMPAKVPDVPKALPETKKAEAKVQPPAKPVAVAAEKQVEQPKQVPHPVQAQPPIPTESAQPVKKYIPDQNVGVTFDGVLISAGSQMARPKGRDPYEVFECRLRVADGVEVPLRGVELERELERCGVQIGERVSITPQGKVPVTLAGGREGSKNVYRVIRHQGGNA